MYITFVEAAVWLCKLFFNGFLRTMGTEANLQSNRLSCSF